MKKTLFLFIVMALSVTKISAQDNYIVIHTNTTGGDSYCWGSLNSDSFLNLDKYESYVDKVIIDGEEFSYKGYKLSDYGFDTSVGHTVTVYYDSPMTDISDMFVNTYNVDFLDMSHFDASDVENMESIIYGAVSLETWVLPANLDITLCEKNTVTSIDNLALTHVYCPSVRLEDYKSYFLDMMDKEHYLDYARQANRVYNCLEAKNSYYPFLAPDEVSITITSADYATYCSDYDLDFSGMTGLKAYIAAGFDPETSVVTIMNVKKVPAGTGLILKGDAGTYNIKTTVTHCLYVNMLIGVNETIMLTPTEVIGGVMNTNFVLSKKNGKVGFYTLANSTNFGPHRAYLPIPSSLFYTNTGYVGLKFEDETDAISNVENSETDGTWYTISGMRVDYPTKGVYIHNGKKVIVK